MNIYSNRIRVLRKPFNSHLARNNWNITGSIQHIARLMNEKTKTKRVGQGLTLSGKADRLATSYLCDLLRGLKA